MISGAGQFGGSTVANVEHVKGPSPDCRGPSSEAVACREPRGSPAPDSLFLEGKGDRHRIPAEPVPFPLDELPEALLPRSDQRLRGRLRRIWRMLGARAPRDLVRWPRRRLIAAWLNTLRRLRCRID